MNPAIVITGIGLTSPLGNNVEELRAGILAGKSGLVHTDVRHMGRQVAGLCQFEATKYMKKKAIRRGTRAGSIAVYCAHEAIHRAGIELSDFAPARVGTYIGITEHGNVETENEIHQLYQNNLNTELWSHHHNPRTVANSPAGEVNLNLKILGPHYTIGAACAAGNMGLIQGAQMLALGEVDLAIAGGVSESPHTFGIYAAFQSQNALGRHEDPTRATRPLAKDRSGIAISEGGALYTLERKEDALKRGATIIAEIVSYALNTDATDYVLPNSGRQIECMKFALERAGLEPTDIDLVSLHATGTMMGDAAECEAVGSVFSSHPDIAINWAKGHIGHAMGAAGALELAANLPSFHDGWVHAGYGVDEIDPCCALPGLVHGVNRQKEVRTILNNAFGMLGINSALIVRRSEVND